MRGSPGGLVIFGPFGQRGSVSTLACAHCGDSFSGRPAESRNWLAAHRAAEHPDLYPTAPRDEVTSPTAPAQLGRRAVRRPGLASPRP
jgi:hypothetical protein